MSATNEEMKQRFDQLPEGIPDVIDAILLFFDTMQKHTDTVTISALTEGLSLAMTDGHDMCEVYLGMMLIAIREAKADEQG